MKTTSVLKLSPMERLEYWINERENIRLLRENKVPPPWTDDVILGSYRFCNVRRMDDRVSVWLKENWYDPNRGHENMLLAIVLARHFNLPDSLKVLGFPKVWNPEGMKSRLREYRDGGNTIFNGAYIIRGNDGSDKIEGVIDFTVGPMVTDPPKIVPESMKKTWWSLIEYRNLGSFMAGQIVADLVYAMEGEWADRKHWAPIGPGSRRGMNRLHSRPIGAPLKQPDFLDELNDLIGELKTSLPSRITSRLDAMDYQNCLCEYDKYCRALLGEGRPKQYYRTKEIL